MEETIRKILEIAVHAPSGDNSQPWRFVVKGSQIDIFNIAERDATVYNFEQRGSYFSHGALIENINIVSNSFGFSTEITLFPDKVMPEQTATITFNKSEARQDPLLSYIKKRATNRKPYKKIPLESNHLNTLLNVTRFFNQPQDTIRFINDRKSIDLLAKVISLNERLILENRPIHDVLFSMIRWTEAEEKANPGLYIKTFELPPPAKLLFRIMKSWSRSQKLVKLGFPKFLAAQTTKLYSACSAMGIILIKEERKEDFLMAGRVFQRLWLEATKNGLSIQPTTALPYLEQGISKGKTQGFSKVHRDLIHEADGKIKNIFQVSEGTISMLFRIGYADEPSARSFKMLPNISKSLPVMNQENR